MIPTSGNGSSNNLLGSVPGLGLGLAVVTEKGTTSNQPSRNFGQRDNSVNEL